MLLRPGRLASLSAIFTFALTSTIQAQSIQEFKKIGASETNYSNYNYGSMIATDGQIGIVAAPGYFQFIINSGNYNTSLSGTIYFLKRDNNGQWTTAGNYVNNPIVDDPIVAAMSVAANSTNLFATMAIHTESYFPVVQVFGFDTSDGHPIVLKTLEMGYRSSQPHLPIAVSGDNLIAGNPPSFFIYNRNQDGPDNWGFVKSFTISAFEPRNLEVDEFGCSASMDGTTAIVGAPDEGNGVVYIYSRDEGGLNNWGQVKTIVAPDGVPGDRFGLAIGISSDVIVVSSVGDDDQGSNSGSVYLYYKDQGGVNNWGFVKKITASDGAAEDQFGQALSLSGAMLTVGAPGDDDSGVDAGSAYVFSRNQDGNDNWGLVTKMLEHSGAAGNGFGSALSSNSDEVLVGSPKADFSGINSGSVEIHNKSVNGPDDWGLVRTMGPSTGNSAAGFRSSMKFNGHFGVVATTDNNRLNPIPNTVPSTGVYLYGKDQGGLNNWGAIVKIPPGTDFNPSVVSIYGGPPASIYYGAYCAIVNPLYHSSEPGGMLNEGEVRIYSQHGVGTWGLARQIGAGNSFDQTNQLGFFGNALAMNEGILAVSAFRTASGQAGDTKGKVLIFDSNMSWGLKNIIVAPDAAMDDYFGSALAMSASTLAISSPFDDDMGSSCGSVYLYMKDNGGTDNWGYLKKITASDGSADDSFGASVDISNDFLVVGAYKDDAGTGSIYIYKMDQGCMNSWGLLKKIQAPDKKEADQFGLTVGIDENSITVGSLLGKTYVFLKDEGGTNNWGFSKMLVPTDFGTLDNFGRQISVADSTIFVSASYNDGTGTAGGAVYAFYKPPNPSIPVNDLPVATITSPADGSFYAAGSAISFSGTGTDMEDGTLPACAFSWRIDFHHASHMNDQPPIAGSTSGTYDVPNEGETSDDVWYRIILTVVDSDGLISTDSVDVLPRKSRLSFATDPPGLQIKLDDQPFDTPGSVMSVEGMRRTIEAVSPQTLNGVEYAFNFWSNGGGASQTITTPTDARTFTATFSRVPKVPVATITSPSEGSFYAAGSAISFSGTGTDMEDGTLPASAFSWRIDFHHASHVHDLSPIAGITSGTYNVPNEGETSADVWYRIILTVMDSDGLTSTDSVDVIPRKSTLSFATDPPGLRLKLDDQPFDAPGSVISVVGMRRTIEAVSPQTDDRVEYSFNFWSNGGGASQTIATPTDDSTFTATFSMVTEVSIPDRMGEMQIYPNPTDGKIVVIKIQSASATEGIVDMMDVMSRHSLKQSISLVPGENSIEIPVSELNSGMHIVMVVLGSKKTSRKLLIR